MGLLLRLRRQRLNPKETMTDYPIFDGAFEIRARGGGRALYGRFPYGKTATIRSAGRVRKERFAPDSMSWQVREFAKVQQEMANTIGASIDKARKELLIEQLEDALERRNTHLLVGHDYNRAVADMRSGSLTVKHTRTAVEIEAELPAEARQPSWVRDAVLAVEGRQLRGISPGFQVPAKGAERLVKESGDGDSLVREIMDSVVFEYSLVARPSYASTTVDARADETVTEPKRRRLWL